MKEYSYSPNKKSNKKRQVVSAIIVIWLLMHPSSFYEVDWYERLAEQMIPLLTYEQQYGIQGADYASDYQVPGWFYEDENVEPVNGDTVMGTLGEVEPAPVAAAPANEEIGTTYTRKQLKKKSFLLSKIFVVDSNTSMTNEELDLANLLDKDLSVEGLKDGIGADGSRQYQILIYHTHGSESFADSREGVKEDTIVGVGSYLTKVLEEQYGIAVYHDETAYDIVDGVLDLLIYQMFIVL